MFALEIRFVAVILVNMMLVTGQSPTSSCVSSDKLCVGLPNGCASQSEFLCTQLVTINVNNEGGLDIDIYGNKTTGIYYAIGFGPEPFMDGLFVDSCDFDSDGTTAVSEGYTKGHKYANLDVGTLTESSFSEIQDNLIHCSFKQKSSVSVSGETFDISNRYYIALAYGKYKDGAIKHHSVRAISLDEIDLKSKGIIDLDDSFTLEMS